MNTTGNDRLMQLQDWLHVLIVAALAAYLVIGILAWTWMLLAGIQAPDAFTTILSTIAGGLVGILAPIGRSPAVPDESAGQEAPRG